MCTHEHMHARKYTHIINIEQQMTVSDATYIIIINFKINQIIFKDKNIKQNQHF